MANHKYHWAIKVGNPRQHRNAWKPGWGGYCVQACGRKYVSTAFPDSAADFVNRAKCNPDWYCADCAKAARLALAKESAPKPSDVVWPKPRPISEASDSRRVLAWFPSLLDWRIVRSGIWTIRESNGFHYPTHFLPLPPEVRR